MTYSILWFTSWCLVENSGNEISLVICDKSMTNNLKWNPDKSELLQKDGFFGAMIKEGQFLTVMTIYTIKRLLVW